MPTQEHVKFAFEPVPAEVPLPSAPLVRVLCQIRFTAVPELLDDALERAIAERLPDYPVRGEVNGLMLMAPVGVGAPPIERLRTYEDVSGTWKVTVGQNFIALETTAYDSRSDFLARLGKVLGGFATVATPPRVERVGMRYVDRVEDPHGLAQLVRQPLLGWLNFVDNPDSVMEHQIVQVQLNDPTSAARVQVRSLFLPPKVIVDPGIAPVETTSWWLDLDAFEEAPRSFDAEALTATVSSLAERAYTVFHWAVTDEFREAFGAKPSNGGAA